MKSNLPVRMEDSGPRFGMVIRVLIQYLILKVIARYSDRLLATGARMISQMIFSGKRGKRRKTSFAHTLFF